MRTNSAIYDPCDCGSTPSWRISVMSSLAVHDLFVLERGWSADQYGTWLSEALARELLPDAAGGESS